jgi:hypothetical protein
VTEAPVTAPAVLPDVPAVEDKLNFGPYARTLLDIILNPDTQTPLTIGIFGSWGSGKTSLMKMIEAGLKRAQESEGGRQTFSVWFNAWLYSKEAALWRALVLQVLAGVRKIRDLDTAARGELNALADQLYRAVGPAELGHLSIMAAELLKEEGTGSAQITLALQHGLDFLQNIAEARQQGELAAVQALRDQVRRATAALEQERIESLERFQAQFEALIEKHVLSRGYLVIFVDDLDRCLPDKAVEVLEAIKLFLDVPGCIFILGIDRDVVERGIRLRYGELGGLTDREGVQLQVDREAVEVGAARYRAFLQELYTDADDVIDGERYLEKIVQIPFVLPPISPQAMGSFVAQLTPNLPDERCGLVFVRGLEPNPRQVKRALNIFALLWALAQNQPYLAGRVSPVRLAKLVVLQQRHGDLYERLREEPSLLIAWERAFRVRRDRETYQEWARTAGFDWQSANSLWSLEAPFPEELETYEGRAALEQLLTMHPLVGDGSGEANFVDMTPEEVYDLIFLAHTAEGGMEYQVQEAAVQSVEWAETPPVSSDEEEARPGPIRLSGFGRFSEEEASYMARQTLEIVAKMSLSLASDSGAVDYVMKELVRTGRRLNEWLRRSVPQDVMVTLADEASAISVSFGGSLGPLMARLPWEMIYDGDEDPSFEKVSLGGFWGGRHVIERPLVYSYAARGLPPTPPLTIPIRQEKPGIGLVLDRGIDANAAMEVFADWNSAGRVRVKPIEEPEAFRESLMNDAEDIYVFYGRGWQEVGEGVIGVGKGSRLRAGEMLNWLGKAPPIKGLASSRQDNRRSLFYFCLQGDPVQELDWSAWTSALQQLGAAGVVAPLSYTPGGWPLQFMGRFFDLFLDGKPLGETLRDARLDLFEKTHNPLGLLYVHFGPPALRLVRAEKAADEQL